MIIRRGNDCDEKGSTTMRGWHGSVPVVLLLLFALAVTGSPCPCCFRESNALISLPPLLPLLLLLVLELLWFGGGIGGSGWMFIIASSFSPILSLWLLLWVVVVVVVVVAVMVLL